jgi:hypothetical protein
MCSSFNPIEPSNGLQRVTARSQKDKGDGYLLAATLSPNETDLTLAAPAQP